MPDSVIHELENATAVYLWERLHEAGAAGTTAAALAERLAGEFTVTPDDALRDVLDFVGVLRDRGLVRSATSREPPGPTESVGPPAGRGGAD